MRVLLCKRNFLFGLIFWLLLHMQCAFAQMSLGSSYGGINISINTSFIANQNNYGQKEMDYDPKITASYGVQFGMPISPKFDFKSGIDFQSLGQAYEDNFSSASFKKEVKFKYISIPLKMKYFFKKRVNDGGERDGIGFYGSFGVQLAFQTSASYKLQINNKPVSFKEFALFGGGNPNELDFNKIITDPAPDELYKTFDVQGYIGLGYQTYLSNNLMLEVEGRLLSTILDFNQEAWRFENRESVYAGSRNVLVGFQLGFNYML